jgi:hypothetical protein
MPVSFLNDEQDRRYWALCWRAGDGAAYVGFLFRCYSDPDLREGGFQPGVIVIVDDAAAGAVVVADQIGRIGQHEIDAAGGQVGHDIDAVEVITRKGQYRALSQKRC